MEPARNTRSQVARRKCHFLRLPAELRNMIYELVLLQPNPIFVTLLRPMPKDPPLLSTCKQIRAEASSVYGQNHLQVQLFNLNITQITNWMRLSPPRLALYQDSEMDHVIWPRLGRNPGIFGGDPWRNFMEWVDLYRQGRCRRLVDPPTGSSDEYKNHALRMAVVVFDIVDELLEKDEGVTMAELRNAVGMYRRRFLRL